MTYLEDGLFWTSETYLSSWGRNVRIRFAPEGRDTAPLAANEQDLIQWCINHETDVSEAALAAVADYYCNDILEEHDDEELPLPKLNGEISIKDLVELQAINIHVTSKNGVPYIGLQFSCDWDDEHGCGVLLHGTRLIKVGGADTAVLLRIAERDANKR